MSASRHHGTWRSRTPGTVAALVLFAGTARAQVVTAHAGVRVTGVLAVPLDTAGLGRRRVLEVLRTTRLQARRKHRLRRAGLVLRGRVGLLLGSGGFPRAGSAAAGRGL